MKYLPFLNGKYTTAPGLIPMEKAVYPKDALVFQIDEHYENYLQNKQDCRKEGIQKYYCEKDLWNKTANAVNWFIIHKLLKEHRQYFAFEKLRHNWQLINKKTDERIIWDNENKLLDNCKYISLFNALCSQVQEDIAICQLNREDDWLAVIHLCAPNHWAPDDKVGKPFNIVHAPVADMEKTNRNYTRMLASVLEKGPFTRFAWGIATDTRLNHHPIAPSEMNEDDWYGRKVSDDDTKFYVRTERQNLIGFPGVNAFLFTIRTYFYELDTLESYEKIALSAALRTMSAASLAYKGLTEKMELLQSKLNT